MKMKMKVKITFCTACMNRLYHLMVTLPRNIENNRDCDCEFLLLDYNSSDNLEDWVKKNMLSYIDSGLLVYYKTREPNCFLHSHARNLMFRLASGDILVNVDADNICPPGFGRYILETMKEGDVFLHGSKELEVKDPHYKGAYGRLVVSREAFYKVRGYDESMVGWGYEDDDFYNRLKNSGLKEKSIEKEFLSVIFHRDEERDKHASISISHSEYLNKQICTYNQRNKRIAVNERGFGRGTVVKNFSHTVSVLYDDILKDNILAFHKINFYTIGMDNLSLLKKTYIDNIERNKDYPNLGFVLLDCNSRGEMGAWAKGHLMGYIESGIVEYYQPAETRSFKFIHAQNAAAKLCTGEIICHLDADAVLPYDFAFYINSVMQDRRSVLPGGGEIGRVGGFDCGWRQDVNEVKEADIAVIKNFEDSLDVAVKLNFGVGEKIKGWRNIDIRMINIREPLLFKDESVSFISIEHVLQFFPHRDAFDFLLECFRILKNDGVLRVCIPDISKIYKNYNEEYGNFIKSMAAGLDRTADDEPLRLVMRAHAGCWGSHAWWTEEMLSVVMKSIGFRVSVQLPRESHYEELRMIDNYSDRVNRRFDVDSIETTVIEGYK
jgi:glycosyltransferase involved in cell wall biosynthesis